MNTLMLAVLLLVVPGGQTDSKFAQARAEVEQLIRASSADISVAFRTLDGKKELLIQPDVSFHAASTMKIPVMIELFAQAKAGKLRLDDPLPVKNEFPSIVDGSLYQLDASDDSDPDPYKAIGSAMTLRQLCEHMITISSNLAANLLIEKLGVENIRRTVHELNADGMSVLRGVEDGNAYERGLNNTTTARALLQLLQSIAHYKAVDRNSSRQMIEILKRQTLNDAIPAGLPPGTLVAHKTGSITKIQHDAAIVYTRRPFVLVVLVRGLEDHQQSAALIAKIAQMLFRATQ
jgi:beta-lactamase class A